MKIHFEEQITQWFDNQTVDLGHLPQTWQQLDIILLIRLYQNWSSVITMETGDSLVKLTSDMNISSDTMIYISDELSLSKEFTRMLQIHFLGKWTSRWAWNLFHFYIFCRILRLGTPSWCLTANRIFFLMLIHAFIWAFLTRWWNRKLATISHKILWYFEC